MQNVFDRLRNIAGSGQLLGDWRAIGYLPRVDHPDVEPTLTQITRALLTRSRARPQFLRLNRQNGGHGVADFVDFDQRAAAWLFYPSNPMHIFTFERGRYDNSQWNVAFTAGAHADDDHVRIGLGFRTEGSSSPGRLAYANFEHRVQLNPVTFDRLMGQLGGGYAEIDETGVQPICAGWILDVQQRRRLAQWRFVGRKLVATEIAAWPVSRFADYCLDTFEAFLNAGFPARYP